MVVLLTNLLLPRHHLIPVVCIRLPWFLGYRHYLEYLHEQTHSRFLQNMGGLIHLLQLYRLVSGMVNTLVLRAPESHRHFLASKYEQIVYSHRIR